MKTDETWLKSPFLPHPQAFQALLHARGFASELSRRHGEAFSPLTRPLPLPQLQPGRPPCPALVDPLW